jgi:hypothetical protein
MYDSTAALAVLLGLSLRLAVPVLITVVVVIALRRVDRSWQSEAQRPAVKVGKPRCWSMQDCKPADRKQCAGFNSPLPCWQVFRQSSGYLQERCLDCPVFKQAPVPVPV